MSYFAATLMETFYFVEHRSLEVSDAHLQSVSHESVSGTHFNFPIKRGLK